MLANGNNSTWRDTWTLRAWIVLAVATIYFSMPVHVLADDAARGAQRDPSPEYLPKPTPSEERILAALEGPTEMDFTETPLQAAIDYLKKNHGIEIQLDNRSLEDAAIGSDTPVTREVNNLKLKSGLELLLRDMDLTTLIKNEVLLITTKDKAETELLMRVYPVGDLVEEKNGCTLIDAITSTVRVTTWDKVGGPGSIRYVPVVKGLIVSQTADVQEDVLELLRALRGTRNASMSVGAKAGE